MKKILFSLCAVFALAFQASAQFSSAVAVSKSAITNLGTLLVLGEHTTNLTLAAKNQVITVGPNGFGVSVNSAGTNSATTTNAVLRFDVSGDAVNWVPNAVSVSTAPAGTGYTPTFTNILASAPNIGNLIFVRLASIQNTNLASTWYTNISITTR